MHIRPLLAFRYCAYATHGEFFPVNLPEDIQKSNSKVHNVLHSGFPSFGLYSVGTGLVRADNKDYCCERCDGPKGDLLESESGYFVGWDVGTLVALARIDDYGMSQLHKRQRLNSDLDLREIRDTISRPALLAAIAPWAVS